MNHHNFLYLRTPLNSLDQTFNGNADSVSEVFKEGLYLASPDYYNQFDKNTILSNKEREKLKNSFNKYWQRSCTRCTPYGTFAGSAVVNLDSNSTEIILDNIYNHNRIVRLDMNFLVIIIKYIEKIHAVKDQL